MQHLYSSLLSNPMHTSPTVCNIQLPEMVQAKQEYLEDDTLVEFSLDASSQLKLVLCEGAGDDCLSQPPQNEVTLSSSLSCLSSTSECLVDTVRVVKVAENRYWEYLPPACVEQAFYENGKKMKTKHGMPSPLEIVGNGWSPAEMFPLDKCHGDCDRDSDCQVSGSLACDTLYSCVTICVSFQHLKHFLSLFSHLYTHRMVLSAFNAMVLRRCLAAPGREPVAKVSRDFLCCFLFISVFINLHSSHFPYRLLL